jgi:hypothetical protein
MIAAKVPQDVAERVAQGRRAFDASTTRTVNMSLYAMTPPSGGSRPLRKSSRDDRACLSFKQRLRVAVVAPVSVASPSGHGVMAVLNELAVTGWPR